MYHFFVRPEQIGEKEIRITGPDVNHIRNVLRMRVGEELRICTGEDDRDFRCSISGFSDEEVTARIMWVEHGEVELPSKIILFQGLPKSDKMELIIQKAVELGAYGIVPVSMKRSVVKLDGGKAVSRVKRWNAISESAAKQSKRMIIPEVHGIVGFAEAVRMAGELKHILVPYELAGDMNQTRKIIDSLGPDESIGVFIGPEGGFEESEISELQKAGGETITLGKRILRTETAGMTVLSILMYHLEA
ncbi:MAG: 16S rRNA (uracil(1498)-N(3))-methyltransferase [Lachnospiraceae bacterium]|nr:16S rRNA (uracil(1498)-N(3))-methyltransferase [Lachnospiraceae bacterium]